MKRVILLVVVAAATLTAACLLCWRQVAFRAAKLAAQKQYADQRAVLNSIPSAPPKRIEPAADFTNMATVEVAGCVIGLPSDQFIHDTEPKRLNFALYHPRYKLLFLGAGEDAKVLDAIKQSVSQTNLYEFVRAVYNATERDISKQRDMDALVRHLILLKAKRMMALVGYEYSCVEFDRGDLKGFIIGDPARTKNLYIRLYIPKQEQFIDLGIIQKAHLQMSEIVELISLLKVKTNNYRATLDAATAISLHIGRQRRGASERGR